MISLVYLRLELSDTHPHLPHLHYTGPTLTEIDQGSSKSYAEALAHTQGRDLSARGAHREAEGTYNNTRCRGNRKVSELTIETFTTMEDNHAQGMSLRTRDEGGSSDAEQPNPTVDLQDIATQKGGKYLDPRAHGSKQEKRKGGKKQRGGLSQEGASCSMDDESSLRPGSGKGRQATYSPPAPSNISFFSGNPAVERTEGIIHLYKDNQMTPLNEEVPRSEMICMLAVPANMTSVDLLQFLAPMEQYIEHMRILRDNTPNQYMVLIKLKHQKYADELYKSYNNQPFNSIEPDICHLVYVASVETVKESEDGSLPIPGRTELPTCPVCLERMDESVDGVLTILCNHSFHGSCLSKWGDTSCPVCRYLQTPEATADNMCLECNSQESLWICLICGHVGCGRYVGGHAYQHFTETSHTYSMQLGSQRVWDYAGDNYVHRLVQNKSDGKLVQVDEGGNPVEDEKLDSLTLEYTYLLTSQLESQRRYFEEKMQLFEQDALKEKEEADIRSKKALEQCERLEQKLSVMTKEKQIHEKKGTQLNTKLTKVSHDLEEEREMNKSLQQNQQLWQKRVTVTEQVLQKKDEEIKDLREQLRDVMFYLEAQQKLAKTTEVSQEEIQEGTVVVSPSGGATGKRGRKKGR